MRWGASIKGWLAAFGTPVNDNTERALRAAGVAVDEDVKDGPEPPDPATFAAGEAAQRQAAEAALAAAAEERGKRIAVEADAFVSGHIGTRLVPAAKEPLVALFSRLAEDDATAAAVVTFGEGDQAKSGGRVDALKALVAAMPELGLTREQLGGLTDAQFKANRERQDGDGKMTEERRKQLMGHTPLGMAASKKGGN